MTTTATLAAPPSFNLLRYAVAADAGPVTPLVITNTGGGTPDLLTDSIGNVRSVIDVGGLPNNAAAQQLLLYNTNMKVSFLTCTGLDIWLVDATIDGGGRPQLVVTPLVANSTMVLDIEFRHSIPR